MSKREENKCERQNVAFLASWGLAILNCLEDQPGLVVGSQWRVGCVMRSCACLYDWISGGTRRTLHHEEGSVVFVQLMMTKASLPYCDIQGQPEAFTTTT